MSITMTCDWCGELIQGPNHDTEDWLRIDVTANAGRRSASGWVGHYHDRCWEEVEEALKLIHSHAPGLAAIPVATDQQLAAARHPDRANGRGGDFTPAPSPVDAQADLEAFLYTLAASPRHKTWRALTKQGIETLEQLDAMSDEEIIALEGMGWITCRKVRVFIAEREAARDASPSNVTSTSAGGA